MARRVTGPLTAVRRVLVVPERLRANPDWSKQFIILVVE